MDIGSERKELATALKKSEIQTSLIKKIVWQMQRDGPEITIIMIPELP